MVKNILQIKNKDGTAFQQFKIIENEALGDCLFHATLEFLKRRKAKFKEIPNYTDELRKRTVEYILSSNAIGFLLNFDRFQDSLMFNLQHHIPNILNYGTNEKVNSEIRHSYRQYMSTPGKFGTFTELCCMAEIFGFSGYMFMEIDKENYNCYDFGFSGNETSDSAKPRMFLLFDGNINSGHFRLLEPINIVNSSSSFSGRYKLSANIGSTVPQPTTTIERVYIDSTEVSSPKNRDTGDNQIDSNIPEQAFICDVCNQSFPTRKCMKVHRNRHANEANLSTTRQLISGLRGSSQANHSSMPINVPESEKKELKAQLDSDCKKWQDIFHTYEQSDFINENDFDKDVDAFLKFMFKANGKMPWSEAPGYKILQATPKKEKRNDVSAIRQIIQSTKNR